MRPLANPRLIIHNFYQTAAEEPARALEDLVAGVETDAYISDQKTAWPIWSRLSESFAGSSRLEAVADKMARTFGAGHEFYLDLKCPFGHEKTALDFIYMLGESVGLRERADFYVISRNHRLIASLPNSFNSGLIITDGLADTRSYINDCRANALVAPPIFLGRNLAKYLKADGVRVVTFPPPNAERLREALSVHPDRVMIDFDLFAEGAGIIREQLGEAALDEQ